MVALIVDDHIGFNLVFRLAVHINKDWADLQAQSSSGCVSTNFCTVGCDIGWLPPPPPPLANRGLLDVLALMRLDLTHGGSYVQCCDVCWRFGIPYITLPLCSLWPDGYWRQHIESRFRVGLEDFFLSVKGMALKARHFPRAWDNLWMMHHFAGPGKLIACSLALRPRSRKLSGLI